MAEFSDTQTLKNEKVAQNEYNGKYSFGNQKLLTAEVQKRILTHEQKAKTVLQKSHNHKKLFENARVRGALTVFWIENREINSTQYSGDKADFLCQKTLKLTIV